MAINGMNPVKTEIEDEVDSLLEEYLSRLKQIQQHLLVQLERVEKAIQAIQKENPSAPNPSPKIQTLPLNKGELGQLRDASWADLFLWGLTRLGGEGTLTDVVNMVSQLPIERVQQRLANSTLYQVMRVHAETLSGRNEIEKVENSKRKGGVMYRL